ncbi:MAG: hypothetical protein ED557_06265 [Balneola sp.]|nr:MAG: hypothetical protein ED557_06265 [Balneola sp.]
MTDDQRKELRDYAWNYFMVHANQRMSLLRFFLIVTSIFFAVYIGLKNSENSSFNAGLVPLVQSIITFIFWRLERRTRELIKVGEDSLKKLDDEIESKVKSGFKQHYKLFESDDLLRKNRNKFIHQVFWFTSYSNALNILYLLIWIGAIALMLHEYKWIIF